MSTELGDEQVTESGDERVGDLGVGSCCGGVGGGGGGEGGCWGVLEIQTEGILGNDGKGSETEPRKLLLEQHYRRRY